MAAQETIEVKELMSIATALYMRSVAKAKEEIQKERPNTYTLFACKGEMDSIEDILGRLYVPGMIKLIELKPKNFMDYIYGPVGNGGRKNEKD